MLWGREFHGSWTSVTKASFTKHRLYTVFDAVSADLRPSLRLDSTIDWTESVMYRGARPMWIRRIRIHTYIATPIDSNLSVQRIHCINTLMPTWPTHCAHDFFVCTPTTARPVLPALLRVYLRGYLYPLLPPYRSYLCWLSLDLPLAHWSCSAVQQSAI